MRSSFLLGVGGLSSLLIAASLLGGCGGDGETDPTSAGGSSSPSGGSPVGTGGEGGRGSAIGGGGGTSTETGGSGGGGGSAPVHYACTKQIGTGSGKLTITSSEAQDGDVVCVKAGTYDYADFDDLTNVVIIPADGPLAFKGSWNIHHAKKLTIDGTVKDGDVDGQMYGITFAGFDGFAIETGASNNQDLTIRGVELDGVEGVDGNNQGNITYDGTDETLLFKNLVMDTFKLTGGKSLFAGTFQGSQTFNNVTKGLTLTHVVVENHPDHGPMKVSGASIYGFLIDHWHISGRTKDTNMDEGIVQLTGSGTISNIYRNGGWGWVGRITLAQIDAPAEFTAFNIVDVNGQNYGTFDLRAYNVASSPMKLFSGNAHLYNITTGNKPTTNNFISPTVIFYGFDDPSGNQYTADVENCFAFDIGRSDANTNKSTVVVEFNSGNPTVHQSHNLEVLGAVGSLPDTYFVDQTDFYPKPGGPLVGKGLVVDLAKKDLYGNLRGPKFDLGAVQHQ